MEEIELIHKKNEFFLKITGLCLIIALFITWVTTVDFKYVSALFFVGVPLGLILTFLIKKKWAVKLTMYLALMFLSILSFFLIVGDPHITSYFVVFFVLVIVRLYDSYRAVIFTSILQTILSIFVYIVYRDSVFESFRGSFDLVFTLIYIWVITLINLGHIRFTNQLRKEVERGHQEILEEKMKVEKLHSLGRLVAGVAHEINTPLGIGLTGTSHLSEKIDGLKNKYRDNNMKRSDLNTFLQQAEETTDLIEKNLSRASKLIKSFKQVSVDQSTTEKRVFNMKEYIEETILTLSLHLKQAKVDVKLSCPQELEIETNPNIFFQIVTNFVMNSLTHAFPVNREQIITILVTNVDGKLFLTYKDNGKGMPSNVTDKVFEPFFTTNRGDGSGLGMHIVHNLVTMTLGGSIDCDSVLGEGTTFSIIIPYQLNGSVIEI